MNGSMIASAASQKTRNCTERYMRGLRNQNGEYLVNIWESVKHPQNVSQI